MGSDRLVETKCFIFFESLLTLPSLLLWHSNDRNTCLKKERGSRMRAGTVTLAEIVGSPAESHRQEAIMEDHARGLRGGPAKHCTLQATCVAHGMKEIGYRYNSGCRISRKRRARTGCWHREWNRVALIRKGSTFGINVFRHYWE